MRMFACKLAVFCDLTMGSNMILLFAVLFAAPFFVSGQFIGYTGPCGQARGGVRIGELPTYEHGVSGTLWIEHAGRFCIENFNYDGQGPDAFLYFYYPGDEVRENGGGYAVRLNDQRAQFAEGREYQGETFRFALPERAPVGCDFGNFSIWCRYAASLFTVLEIPSDIFADQSVNGTSIACSESPGRAFMGVLPTLFHEVSGQLFVKDNKTIIIRNFNYDGLGPDAFVYWYPVGMVPDELGNGFIIPVGDPNVREGAFAVGAGARFTNELYEIRIPDNLDVYTCDIGTFTIWCRQFTQWFTRLEFDTDLFTNSLRVNYYDPSRIYCDRPATRPGVYIGELPSDSASNEVSGAVYVVDEYQLYIQLFNYRPAGCTNAQLYFYVDGQEVQGSGGGYTISFSQSQQSLPRSFTNEDITVDIRYANVNARTCDIKYLTVWCESSQMHLSTIEIPQSIFTDDIGETDAVFCEKRVETDGTSPTVTVSGIFIGLLALATYIFKP